MNNDIRSSSDLAWMTDDELLVYADRANPMVRELCERLRAASADNNALRRRLEATRNYLRNAVEYINRV
jgi:hypothetical protein